jgi:alpha,alpha-trehalose-phosphate synthase [UDP-forming]
MWTKDALQELIQTKLAGYRLMVVANREPYQHRFKAGKIECVSPASGMVSALDPILRATGGVWIAHGSGNADRAVSDAMGRTRVPPESPEYTLRRVWLTKQQEEGYYNGLSNSGIWPLCHKVFTRPLFLPQHWSTYREVNEMFADVALEEAESELAFVFIQDYHFGLLPRLLRERAGNLIVAQFWHIPWPTPDLFSVFPWKEDLLLGLLGNDLLGFHLRYHCLNFLATVERTLEAKVDFERFEITRAGHTTVVRPFPIGIDYDAHVETAESPAVERQMQRWRIQLGLKDEALGIGIDRIDYTKGIPERLHALDRLFEIYPEFRERLIFVQIGVPSRTHVRQYQQIDDEIDDLVETVNWKWSTDAWRPIIYLKSQHSPVEMMALHRLADFCVVSSLDDGMNLVAKEFVASRTDDGGVLVLSQFTGAARELQSAILVNPFAVDDMMEAVRSALTMPVDERRKRMQKLRTAVAENNIYRWAGKFMSALLKFEFPENGAPIYAEAAR